MNEQIKINWYRCKVDKKVMSELMKTSDWQGFKQCVGQLGLFLCTGTMAFLAYKNIHADNWTWAVPFMLFALFLHGTFSCFMGMAAPVHELCHKTPFKTKWINEFFIRIYSFISWTDYIGFRASHVKHHQVTTHTEYDEEVVLPQTLNETVVMVLKAFTFDPVGVYKHIRAVVLTAFGKKTDWIFKSSWMDKVIPDSNVELRKERGGGWRRSSSSAISRWPPFSSRPATGSSSLSSISASFIAAGSRCSAARPSITA